MPSAIRQQLIDLCRDVLAPLLRADGGDLYIVSASDDSLALHLAGTCSGCPGAPTTIRSLIEPAVRTVSVAVRVSVTTGPSVPLGAIRVE